VTPYDDTLYYYEWSQHLSLSYFDGPPLIAYVIRLFTLAFGHTLFALNLVGVMTVSLTCVFVYKTVTLLADEESGWLAAALWLINPLVNQELLLKVTYDNVENLCWVACLYYVIRYFTRQKNLEIYKFAIWAGLLLLSKYTGVLLLIATLVYFISVPGCRAIFRNRHFYYAMTVVLGIFSPVIIWNANHNWISFAYQLNVHKAGVYAYNQVDNVINYASSTINYSSRIGNILHYVNSIISSLNIMLIILIVNWLKQKDQHLLHLGYIKWLILFVTGYWLFASFFANVAQNYLVPLLSMVILLASIYLIRLHWQKLATWIIGIGLLVDILMIMAHVVGSPLNTREMDYLLVLKANSLIPDNSQPIIAPHYVAAERIGYWLKAKPQVYVLSCGLGANQYSLWQQDFMKKLNQGQVKTALFMDYMNEPYCIKPYFKQCTELPVITVEKHNSFTHKITTNQLYIYRCNN